MAFTEEQEEVLKRIIEAFQNGKTINDLPSFVTNGQNAYDLPIETFFDGASRYIKAGDLNTALNRADKTAVRTEINALQRRAEFLERPMIGIEIQSKCIRLKNYEWYKVKGYGLYLFRNIKSRNRYGDVYEGTRRDYEFYSNWRPKGHDQFNRIEGMRDDYEIYDVDAEGFVLKDDELATTDNLIDFYTRKYNGKDTEIRVMWGKCGKRIYTNNIKSTLTFELGLAYGQIGKVGNTERMRVENMVSNLVKFKIMLIYVHHGDTATWEFQLKL